MRIIEREAGLEGRLLRPLCAQLMEETIPEKEGLIDRSRLLKLSGRSRRPQYDLADSLNISEYSAPAGGCLLTDRNFARRMSDTLEHGYRNFRETIALQWGRHFRYKHKFKMILGRNEAENESLQRYAHSQDIVMKLPADDGPTLILKGDSPDEHVLAVAAGLIQRYSKYKDELAVKLVYWPNNNKDARQKIISRKLPDEQIDALRI